MSSTLDYFECPRCGIRSFHPIDIAQGYCSRCHDWTGLREDMMTGVLPDYGGGPLCDERIGHGVAQFPCTLPRGHEAHGEPHFAIEVAPSVRAWQNWKHQATTTLVGPHVPALGSCTGTLVLNRQGTEATCNVCGALVGVMTRLTDPIDAMVYGSGDDSDDDAIVVLKAEARRDLHVREFRKGLVDTVDEVLDEMDEIVAEPIVDAVLKYALSFKSSSV